VASGATAVQVDPATQAATEVGDVMTFTNGDTSETVTVTGFGSANRRRVRAAAAIKFKPKLKGKYDENVKVSLARPQFDATVLTGISFPGQSTSFCCSSMGFTVCSPLVCFSLALFARQGADDDTSTC